MKEGQNLNLCLHLAKPNDNTTVSSLGRASLRHSIYLPQAKIYILLMAITCGVCATCNGHQEGRDFIYRALSVGFQPSFMDFRPI